MVSGAVKKIRRGIKPVIHMALKKFFTQRPVNPGVAKIQADSMARVLLSSCTQMGL